MNASQLADNQYFDTDGEIVTVDLLEWLEDDGELSRYRTNDHSEECAESVWLDEDFVECEPY